MLRSPDFAASQNDALCLSFWFAPFGRGEATALSVIRVELTPPEGQEKDQRLVVWKMATKKFDTSRPDWMYGQVSVATLTAYRVSFEKKKLLEPVGMFFYKVYANSQNGFMNVCYSARMLFYVN